MESGMCGFPWVQLLGYIQEGIKKDVSIQEKKFVQNILKNDKIFLLIYNSSENHITKGVSCYYTCKQNQI